MWAEVEEPGGEGLEPSGSLPLQAWPDFCQQGFLRLCKEGAGSGSSDLIHFHCELFGLHQSPLLRAPSSEALASEFVTQSVRFSWRDYQPELTARQVCYMRQRGGVISVYQLIKTALENKLSSRRSVVCMKFRSLSWAGSHLICEYHENALIMKE